MDFIIENFIEGLKKSDIEQVVIDYNGENKFVYLSCLQNEIGKIGITEIVDTYYEDLIFINGEGELVEVHAFY